MPIYRADSRRTHFAKSLTRKEIRALVNDERLQVLQCSAPVESATWKLLNDRFFSKRPDVLLRVFGFYSLTCDLSFASRMTNVCHFSADCLMDAVGFEAIAAMEKLESLGIGVFHLDSFAFLNQVIPHLKKLSLHRTKSKKPDLSVVKRFDKLEIIYLEGQQKHIEVLAELQNVKDVTLRSISTADLSYLTTLDQMWSLDIKLGGIKDLTAITGMEDIKYLELRQIRGVSDIQFISSLTGLQYLFLQSLRHVPTLPSLDTLKNLRRIHLDNMKGLKDISSLEYAPALETFSHYDASHMQLEDYQPLLRNPSLKQASVGFGSFRRNDLFKDLARDEGIKPVKQSILKFDFV